MTASPKMTTSPCTRCGGKGTLQVFRHVENGVCFACGGKGTLTYRPTSKPVAESHPELVIPEGERSTIKQWEYLEKLIQSDDEACRILRAVGAPMATQRYVSRSVMSRAIEMAKAG